MPSHFAWKIRRTGTKMLFFTTTQSAAILIAELRGLPLTTKLGSFNDNNNKLQQITSAEIQSAN
jgi:hypothetical protein